MPTTNVHNDPSKERYVVEVDGVQAGFTVYHIRSGRYFFVHTEIYDDFAGTGVGKTLVREALDDIRAQGEMIVPVCPYVAHFIHRNPEYQDLVDHEIFDRIAERLHLEN